MFKTILAFIKAHTIATAITTTVVVSTAVATPIVVENYKLDKEVKENLNMLVSSNYNSTSDNKEEEKNVILNNDEQPTENKPVNTNEPLTFRIEKVYHKTEGGNIVKDMQGNDAIEMSSEGIEYVIVPSYDKDYSKWSKSEKEAYQRAFEETNKMAEEQYKSDVANEKQTIADIERELQLEFNSWSKEYLCGVGTISYNSYTKKYKGNYLSKTQTTFLPDSSSCTDYLYEDINNISKEEFRNTIYPMMLQKFKEKYEEKKEQYPLSEIQEYKSNLETVYHLSD